MDSSKKAKSVLEDVEINVKIKLSALWASLMFCYIYGDWLTLFEPGFVEQMIAGKFGPLGPTTQATMLGVAIFITIPAVMVFLSLVLKPQVNRWANIIFGGIYTVAVLTVMLMGPWVYYVFLGIVEMSLTVLIVRYAWKWPEQEA